MATTKITENSSMVQFISNDHLTTVNSMIARSKRLDAAVAYWGKGAVNSLDLRKIQDGATFICNLYSQGCNPHEIQKLYDMRRFRLMRHEGLHAKVYLTNDAVFVGSSNVSDRGLGFLADKPSDQREVNILCREMHVVSEARTWLDKIIDESQEIKQPDLDEAKRNYGRLPSHTCELIDLPRALLKSCRLAVLVWSVEAEDDTVEKAKRDYKRDKRYSIVENFEPEYFDSKENAKKYPYNFDVLAFKSSSNRQRLYGLQGVF